MAKAQRRARSGFAFAAPDTLRPDGPAWAGLDRRVSISRVKPLSGLEADSARTNHFGGEWHNRANGAGL
jgi:hypothetical protein